MPVNYLANAIGGLVMVCLAVLALRLLGYLLVAITGG
jgi:hypothetical protein